MDIQRQFAWEERKNNNSFHMFLLFPFSVSSSGCSLLQMQVLDPGFPWVAERRENWKAVMLFIDLETLKLTKMFYVITVLENNIKLDMGQGKMAAAVNSKTLLQRCVSQATGNLDLRVFS